MNDDVRIQQLNERLRETSQQLDEALSWNNVLLSMLMTSEAKLNGVREALGDEIIQEHPGKVQFRKYMADNIEEDDNA